MNVIIPRRKAGGLIDFLLMSNQQVQEKFLTLPNAVKVGTGLSSFVFVPGTRKDRVLLVAHSDTIPNDRGITLANADGDIVSLRNDLGIGADDRAGCSLLWKMRNLGHSLLIPNGEEKHGMGSHFLMTQDKWVEEIKNHSFALEFDRRGSDDLASYDVDTKEFVDFCEENYPGYTQAQGSYTDIATICKDICGLNVSIGYNYEHTPKEYLNLRDYTRTLSLTYNLLTKSSLPKFKLERKKYQHSNTVATNKYFAPTNGYALKLIKCQSCGLIQDEIEFKQNLSLCVSCNTP